MTAPDPITAHAARQPGIATYAGMPGTDPIRPWTAHGTRTAPARITPTAEQIAAERDPGATPKPAARPAQSHGDATEPRPGGSGHPEPAQAIVADHRRSQAVDGADKAPDLPERTSQAGEPLPPDAVDLEPATEPTARPRPKPRPPWWRIVGRIRRALTHRED